MKHVSDLIKNAKDQIQKPRPHEQEITDEQWELSFGMINRLFEDLTAIFNASHQTWRTDEELANAKNQWLIALVENRIFEWDRIEIALRKCRRYPKAFCPNIGEFISWCDYSPEDFGLPDVNTAYDEAIANYGKEKEKPLWTHLVVRHTAYYCGSYDLMNLSRDKSFSIFERNYQIAIKKYINGELGEFKLAITNGQGDEEIKKDKVTKAEYKQVRNGADALRLMKAML